jgi:hypothetical protein
MRRRPTLPAAGLALALLVLAGCGSSTPSATATAASTATPAVGATARAASTAIPFMSGAAAGASPTPGAAGLDMPTLKAILAGVRPLSQGSAGFTVSCGSGAGYAVLGIFYCATGWTVADPVPNNAIFAVVFADPATALREYRQGAAVPPGDATGSRRVAAPPIGGGALAWRMLTWKGLPCGAADQVVSGDAIVSFTFHGLGARSGNTCPGWSAVDSYTKAAFAQIAKAAGLP